MEAVVNLHGLMQNGPGHNRQLVHSCVHQASKGDSNIMLVVCDILVIHSYSLCLIAQHDFFEHLTNSSEDFSPTYSMINLIDTLQCLLVIFPFFLASVYLCYWVALAAKARTLCVLSFLISPIILV